MLLGLIGDRAYFALDLSSLETPLAALRAAGPVEFTDLRRVGPLLAHQDGALLAYARGIPTGTAGTASAASAAAPTRSEEGGHVRRCTNPSCNAQHFPRTDPAVIMLVHDGERCLLGRQRAWPAGHAFDARGLRRARREPGGGGGARGREESAIIVDEVRYHSSQPWPFPASIMLGFHARARSTECASTTASCRTRAGSIAIICCHIATTTASACRARIRLRDG